MDLSGICARRKECSRVGISAGAFRRGRMLVCLTAMLLIAATAQPGQQGPQPGAPPGAQQAQKDHEANHGTPDAETKAGAPMPDQRSEKPDSAISPEERNREIAEDSARLLKMATDLKIAVDKTTLDTLSLAVIRKAEDIEKLARSIREKVKVSQNSASSRK